jgi:cardiolipin synthase
MREPTGHCVDGNNLHFLTEGPDRLAALLSLIEGARSQVCLYFYIFAADASGQRVREALIDACNRGVQVTLLVDAFGSATLPAAFLDDLRDAGARIGHFGRRRSTRYLIRNHQKMAIADGSLAIIGGFNIQDGYFADATDPDGWRDLGLQIEGPCVADLARWYETMAAWVLDDRQRFRALTRMVREWSPGQGAARWLMGGPARHLNGWARGIINDMQAARSLDLVAAYFSPPWSMMRRMGRVARRGRLRLMTPARSDNSATIGAARHLYRRLLNAGASLFEYQPAKLHMKLIVMDDVTYIGSANFDMRSLFINVEMMVRIDDAAFADAARGLIDGLEQQARPIDKRRHRSMAGPVARLHWWLSYLLVGVLDYTVTRRLNFRDRSSDRAQT